MWGTKIFICQEDSCRKVYQRDDRAFFSHEMGASPKADVLAAISRPREFDQSSSKLLLFTKEGKLLITIPDVQRYAWSPDGKAIACITGTDVEGFGFRADKLILINSVDWSQRVLKEGITYQDIFWAEFDSMIYTTDYQYVYRIDPRARKVEKTKYQGIYFSPDGRYYYSANYEGAGFGVYERATNRDVTPEGYKANPAVNFHQWLPEGSTLVFGDIFREKQVFDVATRTTRKTISGQVLGYNKQTKEFIVLKHHRYFPEVPDKKVERIADGR